jgi:hypothetical protein
MVRPGKAGRQVQSGLAPHPPRGPFAPSATPPFRRAVAL